MKKFSSFELCPKIFIIPFLDGGFKDFLFLPRFSGEMMQFDLRIFCKWTVKNQLDSIFGVLKLFFRIFILRAGHVGSQDVRHR